MLRNPLTFGILFLLLTRTINAQIPDAPALQKQDERMKADLLIVVAHPDDETVMGSELAKMVFDDHRRIAVVYCNRGTGGGNSHGIEQSNAMGLIREMEVRKALAQFGIFNVWFLNGKDTPGQDVFRSLSLWGHGQALEDLVRIVRLTRPEVIATWLPDYAAGENHGDHQASGVIATEAFDMAGDPMAFPVQVTVPRERIDIGQLNEGLSPWQPKKLYFFSDASHKVEGDGPKFDWNAVSPSKSQPYYKVAAELSKYHLTQGDVADAANKAIESGNYDEFKKSLEHYHLLFGKSLVKCSPNGDVFEGITEAALPFTPPRGYQPEQRKGVSMELGGVWSYYKNFWRTHNIERVAPLIQPELEIAANNYTFIPLLLHNDTGDSVTVTVTGEFPKGWKPAYGNAKYRIAPHSDYPVQTFTFAPAEVSPDFQTITWKAEYNGKSIATIPIRIRVSEWTLPE